MKRFLFWLFPWLAKAETAAHEAERAAVDLRMATLEHHEKWKWVMEDAIAELEYVVKHGTHMPAEDDGDPNIVLLIDRLKRALKDGAT